VGNALNFVAHATSPLHPFLTIKIAIMQKLADVLEPKYPQFNTVSYDCFASDALYQMACENVDHLIVINDADRFMGIITDHDIASKVLFDERPLKKIRVKEYMTRTIPTATPDDSLEHCMQLMDRFHSKHVAVFRDFEFCGIVSSHDLMHQAVNKRKAIFEEQSEVRQGYPWNY
jgi:CBS domain-containing protein